MTGGSNGSDLSRSWSLHDLTIYYAYIKCIIIL